MTFTEKQIYDLNNSNVASQNVQLGDFLNDLTGVSTGSAVSITGGTINGVKFGNQTDYASFESDGTLVFTGSATVWDDLVVPLTTAKQGQTDKPPFDTTNVGYWFPYNDATNVMYMIVQLPHSWKVGSIVYPHVHYQQTNSGSPVFKLDYKWTNIGGNTSGSFTTYTISGKEMPWSGSPMHQIAENSSGITGTGKGISSILQLKLYRDDTTYSGSVLTYQFDVHYEKDTLGSRTEWSK